MASIGASIPIFKESPLTREAEGAPSVANHSLRIDFDGSQNLYYDAVAQFVPVEPSTKYDFFPPRCAPQASPPTAASACNSADRLRSCQNLWRHRPGTRHHALVATQIFLHHRQQHALAPPYRSTEAQPQIRRQPRRHVLVQPSCTHSAPVTPITRTTPNPVYSDLPAWYRAKPPV